MTIQHADKAAVHGFPEQHPYALDTPDGPDELPHARPDLYTAPPSPPPADPSEEPSLERAAAPAQQHAAVRYEHHAPSPYAADSRPVQYDSERIRATVDAWLSRIDFATTCLIGVVVATVLGVILRGLPFLHTALTAIVTTISIPGLLICVLAAVTFSSAAVRQSPWAVFPADKHLMLLIPGFIFCPLVLAIAGAVG